MYRFTTRLTLTFLFVFVFIFGAHSQYVYKTPSGAKYHLSSCSSVKNVSKRITIEDAVNLHYLTPCKRCQPPAYENPLLIKKKRNKAVGKCTKVYCAGWAKTYNRQCSRTTKMCNGYCFQHQPAKKE